MKVGGAKRLVKFVAKPKYIYEFNLDRFDLNTLKDGDVQWTVSSSKPTLSKSSDSLDVTLKASGSPCQLNLPPNNFDINQPYFIESLVTIPSTNEYIYAGPSDTSVVSYSRGLGSWFYVINSSNFIKYKGTLEYTSYDWNRLYIGYNYSMPINIKVYRDPSNSYKEFYLNDELIYSINAPSRQIFTINNGNGDILSTIKLHSLKIIPA